MNQQQLPQGNPYQQQIIKKPIYKKWWFWLIVIVVIGVVGTALGSGATKTADTISKQIQTDTNQIKETTANENSSTSKANTYDSETIALGEPIFFDSFIVTITEYKVIEDRNRNKGLRITYDWENIGDEAEMPFITFGIKAFQDNVETNDDFFISDDLDLGTGQKDVRPGGIITGAHSVVGIDDIDKPLIIELSELFSWSNDSYEVELDLSSVK